MVKQGVNKVLKGDFRMKLGFVSAILDQANFEEMMDTASRLGFQCVEAASWPMGKAERRYAGVSHIDAERVLEDESYCKHILDYSRKSKVEISSLAFYPNTLDANLKKRTENGVLASEAVALLPDRVIRLIRIHLRIPCRRIKG